METDKSPAATPTPVSAEAPAESATTTKRGAKSKRKARNPKRKSKKSKSDSPSATVVYVPVLVQSLPPRSPPMSSYGHPSSSRKTKKAGQPVLNDQQMQEWRCQADHCPVRAPDVGKYYQRHRICPEHSKAPSVIFNGTEQRYCQQCSRFHELAEFDGSRRSCRRQLCRRRLIRTLNTFSSEEVEQI